MAVEVDIRHADIIGIYSQSWDLKCLHHHSSDVMNHPRAYLTGRHRGSRVRTAQLSLDRVFADHPIRRHLHETISSKHHPACLGDFKRRQTARIIAQAHCLPVVSQCGKKQETVVQPLGDTD